MAKITYIEHDGTSHTVDAPNGATVMGAAIDNGVPGIDADCGGNCACATCHVFVSEDWLCVVGGPGDLEENMLDMNPERASNSRLACQIDVDEHLDGLVVTLPEFQF
ncbi:MAG: 2Fe-2S iron-sulfur cluster-binding protein [Alphaproteobacteria bacterium]